MYNCNQKFQENDDLLKDLEKSKNLLKNNEKCIEELLEKE